MKKKGSVKKSSAKKKVSPAKSSPPVSQKSKAQLIAEEKEKVRSKPYPIVGIGASAGGIQAMTQLLKNLSPNTGMAFVYIQHLDPTHESLLDVILSKHTTMPVMEAQELMRIQPDHVFVIPPNKDMQIVDGVLTLNPRPLTPKPHLPINRFFTSLADKQKEGSIGIILSGSASDGTIGLKAIKAAGGITFAQDESAKFQSMPKSAIAEGGVDLVLSPAEMAKELGRLAKEGEAVFTASTKKDAVPPKEEENDFNSIVQLLRKSTGADFTNYKKNTIYRRMERRMLLQKLSSLRDYNKYLAQHAAEVTLLYQDLLINVTSFFRDAELTEYLKKTVLPQVIKDKSLGDPIRIWIPACSTGQEAYSLAILLLEALGKKAESMPVQIFSSDLSENAISKARIGLYSKSEVADVSPARLQRFFSKEDNSYRVVKSIRDLCVFATHNIFRDPPFSRLDMVSCCNLLIYLDPVLQKKAITLFHYALNPDGYLVLGETESIGTAANLFSPLSKKLKIYKRKKGVSPRASFEMSFSPQTEPPSARKIYLNTGEKEYSPDLERTVDNLLLNRFIPACVVVNEDLEIQQFRGSTGLFLEPSPGRASLNLLKMARPGLGFELRNAIHKAIKTDKTARKKEIEIKGKDASQFVSIEVVPLKSGNGGRYFLVLFEEEQTSEVPAKGKSKDRRVEHLEAELHAAREDMSAIIEEREAMNEELQSANEEVVSSNEELQSINEELETSKEEIESTNEELQTINQELTTRNEQLSEAFNFADAVFSTMREALLVLDEDLRILRANRSFYRLFKTTEEETERRLIYELGNHQWNIPKLRELLENILEKNKQFYGFEVSHVFPDIGEKIMILNARKIEQPALRQQLILLAIEDITDHVVAGRILKERELWMRNTANTAPVMIWTSDINGNRNFFNDTWLKYTGKTEKHEHGMGWLENVHPDDRTPLLKIYNDAFEAREPYQAEYRLRRHDGEYRWVLSSGNPSFDERKTFTGFIGTVTDIHDKKVFTEELENRVQRRAEALRDANQHLERSNEELKQFAYVASHDLQEPLRKISTFSDQLQTKFKSDLPETAQDYLDRMKKAAIHMSKLIDAILDFSRAGRPGDRLIETDLNAVVKRVLKDYELGISEKKAMIHVGRLPVIHAIHVQMLQLFSNLIGNSLKFSKNNGSVEINIDARKLGKKEMAEFTNLKNGTEYYEITVKDNGIGFGEEYSERIFNIFQRLHGRHEYPGTGIGLALCRKIADSHGGVIYAKSEQEKGSEFHVILPENHA